MAKFSLYLILILTPTHQAYALHSLTLGSTQADALLEKTYPNNLIESESIAFQMYRKQIHINTSSCIKGFGKLHIHDDIHSSIVDSLKPNFKSDSCNKPSVDLYIHFESCPGACDPVIEVDGAGGQPPYTYAFEGDLCGGFFTIFITDALGCMDSVIGFIIPLPDLDIQDIQIIEATNGQSNGYVEVEIQGGTPPYLYSLDGLNYQFSPVFTNLAPGTYCITVKDANECTLKMDAFTIQNSTSITELFHKLRIYPNPVHSNLFVSSDTPVSLDLLDINGFPLKQTTYLKEHEMVLAEFPRGIYFLRITDVSGHTFQRLALH